MPDEITDPGYVPDSNKRTWVGVGQPTLLIDRLTIG